MVLEFLSARWEVHADRRMDGQGVVLEEDKEDRQGGGGGKGEDDRKRILMANVG